MPNFLFGKRKSENTVTLTFIKKANIEDISSADEGQDQQQNETLKRHSLYSDMPVDIFIKICSYMSFRETMQLGRVCRRWYHLTKHPVFWRHTDLISLNLSPEKAERFFLSIPPCVVELRIGNCADELQFSEDNATQGRQMLNVPAIYNTLSERFPALEVLIIENAFLVNSAYHADLRYGFVLNCKVPSTLQVRRSFTLMEYKTPTPNTGFYALVSKLQDITVLSLRSSVLAVNGPACEKIRNTPSRIRVLDLTKCKCVLEETLSSFCQLPFLEELYLSGTAVTVNGVLIILKEVHRLKVLDLDDTVISSETFTVLRRHGQSLVKLYLGKTTVRDFDMIGVGEETFPHLEELCLQSTPVSEIGVKNLLLSVHSLKNIILTNSRVNIAWMVDQSCYMKAKMTFDVSDGSIECNHFLQNKFHKKNF